MKLERPTKVYDCELLRDIGSLPAGTQGTLEWFDGGPHAFYPLGSRIGRTLVGITVNEEDVRRIQEE